jgi:uncharacterized protein (DUF305 family)
MSLALAAGLGFCSASLLRDLQVMRSPSANPNIQPGPVDIGFAQFMTAHHDQAVTLCQIVLARGNSKVSAIANSILVEQLMEMGRMQGWLSLWGKPLIPTSRHMDWLLAGRTPPDATLLRYVADCNVSPGGMKGLATNVELNRLRELDGDVRDRFFLQLMIRHHAGALPMAEFAAQNADTPVTRGIAGLDMIEQSKELGTLQMLLQTRG